MYWGCGVIDSAGYISDLDGTVVVIQNALS